MSDRKLIGVFPVGRKSRRPRFFDALERVFPVSFKEFQSGEFGDLDGALLFGATEQLRDEMRARGVPCLAAPDVRSAYLESGADTARVTLAQSSLLNATLRGRALNDTRAARVPPVSVEAGEEVVASHIGSPLWVVRADGRSRMDRVAVSPLASPDGQPLRDQLRQGNFLTLLPIVEFLRSVTAHSTWTNPPLRASFVVDDPNLHWHSYGYLDYPTLLQEARRHGYHVAIAMVPLDGGFARRDVTALFRQAPDSLSLLIHGNNHSRNELEEFNSEELALRVLAQAIRRVAALEKRSGVPISRVMAAPHERCSGEAMSAMFRLGFEGICIDWRYPWRFRPDPEKMLAGFDQAELLAGGLPLMGRDYVADSKEGLVFRAYLSQPLLLYGHHQDLGEGLDLLRSAAREVNNLGDVRWCSLSSIARTNYQTQREGATLAVRMLSRRITVDIPKDVTFLRIETPIVHAGTPAALINVNGQTRPLVSTDSGWRSEPLPIRPGLVEIILESRSKVDPWSVSSPPRRVWPVVRRVLGESRDRLQPLAIASRRSA